MKIQHFTENTVGKDYVVGDIHGCFDKLQEELDAIGFDETKDRLFSVGDLVDRGPLSEEVLDWLAKPWFFSVRGNHEQMAIDYMTYKDGYTYSYNGGQWFIQMKPSHQQLYVDVFKDLPIAIDIKVGDKLYGIIHAECPTKSWDKLDDALNEMNAESFENVAMWNRDKYRNRNTSCIDGVELLYVGHTPLKDVTVLGNVVYIDTGAVFGNRLTILEIY